MAYIQTVTGKVDVEKIRNTDAHSHLIAYATDALIQKDSDLLLDSVDKIHKDMEVFKSYDGNLIAEMTTVDYRSDPEALKKLSQRHDIYIIACTGFNKGAYNRPFLENRDIDEVAAKLLDTIQNGISPSQIKPGLIKIGTSLNEITPWEEIGLRAAARAHLQSGVPISTHTQGGTMALAQLRMFEEEKVPYENLILCHLDQLEDFELHRTIVSKGVFLSYDSIAKAKYQTRERALRYITALAKEQLHTQILVGNDFARRSCLEGYGGKPGYHSVFRDFKQELMQALITAGFSQAQADQIINDIYRENPKRAFALRAMERKQS